MVGGHTTNVEYVTATSTTFYCKGGSDSERNKMCIYQVDLIN